MLLSPQDDFEHSTLAAVPGSLSKLAYIAALRRPDGRYYHWGMARRYGEENASTAISRLHSSFFLTMLRTPIVRLWEEVSQAASQAAPAHELGCSGYLAQLLNNAELMVPPDLAGGSLRHFNSILAALSALASAPLAGLAGPDA